MKRFAKTAIAAALLTSALFLNGCNSTLMSLSYTDDQFINKGENLYYNYAPISYEPVSVGEPYAYCADMEMTFCEIPGVDPKEWLTEEFSGTATTVLYNENITLPTLAELDPDKIFVCLSGERIFSLATVEDQAAIDEIIRVFNEGEEAVWPLVNATLTYHLKFYSEKNAPAIYYNLIYGEFAEGNFLYEQGTGRCVEVGSLIMDLEV